MLKKICKTISFLAVFINSFSAFSQCAMCKAANESNEGSAEGFNAAILFLMTVPYVIGLVAVIIFVVYWRKRKK